MGAFSWMRWFGRLPASVRSEREAKEDRKPPLSHHREDALAYLMKGLDGLPPLRVRVASGPVCKAYEAVKSLSASDFIVFGEIFDEMRRGGRRPIPTTGPAIGMENPFGKMRGRFDEAAARRADRSLCEAAIAAIVPMPEAEFARFVALFNEIYDRPGRVTRWAIGRCGG